MPTFNKLCSGKWRVQVRRKGIYLSRTFATKTRGRAWAIQIETEIDDGLYQDPADAPPILRAALDRYEREFTPHKRSIKPERHRLRTLAADPVASLPIDKINGAVIADLRDRLGSTRSNGTVRLMLALLSHVFTVARKEWGYYQLGNPVRDIRMPPPGRPRDRRLSREEAERLLRAGRRWPNRELLWIVRLALETAARQGEILKLLWEDINLDTRVALLRKTKNGDDRLIPLSGVAIRIIRHIQRVRGLDGKRKPRGPVFRYTGHGLRSSWRKLLNEAGIEGFRFHDLRHEATSRLFERGTLSMMEVSSITGHKTLSMLKRYTHLNVADLAKKL